MQHPLQLLVRVALLEISSPTLIGRTVGLVTRESIQLYQRASAPLVLLEPTAHRYRLHLVRVVLLGLIRLPQQHRAQAAPLGAIRLPQQCQAVQVAQQATIQRALGRLQRVLQAVQQAPIPRQERLLA